MVDAGRHLAFRAGLFTSVHPIWKLPHRRAERFISMAILDPVKLTILTITVLLVSHWLGFLFIFSLLSLRTAGMET